MREHAYFLRKKNGKSVTLFFRRGLRVFLFPGYRASRGIAARWAVAGSARSASLGGVPLLMPVMVVPSVMLLEMRVR